MNYDKERSEKLIDSILQATLAVSLIVLVGQIIKSNAESRVVESNDIISTESPEDCSIPQWMRDPIVVRDPERGLQLSDIIYFAEEEHPSQTQIWEDSEHGVIGLEDTRPLITGLYCKDRIMTRIFALGVDGAYHLVEECGPIDQYNWENGTCED